MIKPEGSIIDIHCNLRPDAGYSPKPKCIKLETTVLWAAENWRLVSYCLSIACSTQL